MRKITQAEFDKSYKLHERWLRGFKTGVRLNFGDCDLTEITFPRQANLYGADLQAASLCNANLQEANLCNANLQEATLYGANLQEANLYGVNLHGANLRNANLHGANLRNANLHGADLRRADLRGADLQEADLRDADLHGADLRGAKLQGADLHGADLDYACWPLWCGSQAVKIDEKQLYQLIAHVCAVTVKDSEDFAEFKRLNLKFAEKSHIYVYLKDSIDKEES